MVCPKCKSPYATIWMDKDIKRNHRCVECGTSYHEDNEIERLELVIKDIKNKLKNKTKRGNINGK